MNYVHIKYQRGGYDVHRNTKKTHLVIKITLFVIRLQSNHVLYKLKTEWMTHKNSMITQIWFIRLHLKLVIWDFEKKVSIFMKKVGNFREKLTIWRKSQQVREKVDTFIKYCLYSDYYGYYQFGIILRCIKIYVWSHYTKEVSMFKK